MSDISIATFSLTEGDNGAQVSIVFSDGTPETITDKHANFEAIKTALMTKPEGYGALVRDLANIAKTVARKFADLSPRVSTDGNDLFFDGDKVIANALSSYILKLLREDAQQAVAFFEGGNSGASEKSETTWKALVNFLELLYSNPNPQSRESLYEFITRYGLTIRKDGHFIAYKGLEADFGSRNKGYGIVDGVEVNGTLYNKPGSVLRFPRKDVDANTAVGCSQGLHAGTHAYASNWGRGGKLVAVAINPMNVVSVPDDCTFQKLRVCEYEVLNEVDPLEDAVATSGWDSASLWDEGDDEDDCDCGDCDGSTEATDDFEEIEGFLNSALWDGAPVSFDYVSADGTSQHISEARIEEISHDYFKAFVPAKDGYRTFKFEGISNLDEAATESEESTDEPVAEPAKEKKPEAANGSDFFDSLGDLFANGAGFKLENFPGIIPSEIREEGKKLLEDTGFGSILGDLFGGTKAETKTETPETPAAEPEAEEESAQGAVDLSEGDTVSFDYTSSDGTSQHISEAKVSEVQAEYFKAFVPEKDGYRTFKFDGVSNIGAPETQRASIFDTIANLKNGDVISVVLDIDGKQLSFSNAIVKLADGVSVTVQLASRGYRAFTANDVVSISVES